MFGEPLYWDEELFRKTSLRETRMEIRQLYYFILIAEEKSFGRASKRAFVSQQALSKAIQNLEIELGVPLFERTKSGVELTPYGKVMLDKSIRITSIVDDTFQELSVIQKSAKKIIRLGIAFRVFEHIPADDMFKFQSENPEIEIDITEASDKTIENKIFREKFDIGCLSSAGDAVSFNHYLVKKSPTFVVMHKDYPLADRERLTIKDLKYENFLGPNDDYNAHNRLIDICREAGFVPNIKHLTSNILWIRQLLLLNKGIFLCGGHPDALLNHDEIIFRPLEDDPHIYAAYIITKKNRVLSKHAVRFLDYLIEITNAALVN
jgi:DNA-binding transcriptional LysR family regulator